MFEVERRDDSWEIPARVGNAVLLTVVLVSVVLSVLLISRQAASSSPQGVVVAEEGAKKILTSGGGGITGPGLRIDSADLDAERCVTVEAGSAVLTQAGTETSSVWVYASPGDLVRVDYKSPSTSESSLISQRALEHNFAPGRVTVTVMAGDPSATVRFVALSSSARLCGLAAE